ncbi:MAG: PAS domain-containing protein [Ktedonobacteraceae bacterium]|nr:PAS domain-containing protein [Ktedonobacteraceae bacterium]
MSQNSPQSAASAQQLEAYFASLPDAIMVWDRTGKMLFLNAAALRLFEVQDTDPWVGTSAQQFLRRYTWCDEQHRSFSFAPWLLNLTTVTEETVSFPYEQTLLLVLPSHHQLFLELRCSLVRDSQQPPIGVLAAFHVVAPCYQQALHTQRVYQALTALNEAIAQLPEQFQGEVLMKPFSSPLRCSLLTNSSWMLFVRFWRAGA